MCLVALEFVQIVVRDLFESVGLRELRPFSVIRDAVTQSALYCNALFITNDETIQIIVMYCYLLLCTDHLRCLLNCLSHFHAHQFLLNK